MKDSIKINKNNNINNSNIGNNNTYNITNNMYNEPQIGEMLSKLAEIYKNDYKPFFRESFNLFYEVYHNINCEDFFEENIDPIEKIEYNNLQSEIELLTPLYIFNIKFKNLAIEYENIENNAREKKIRNILYSVIKKEYNNIINTEKYDDIEKIRENSTKIIMKLHDNIKKQVTDYLSSKSSSIDEYNVRVEKSIKWSTYIWEFNKIDIFIYLYIVYEFSNCKIMERPTTN